MDSEGMPVRQRQAWSTAFGIVLVAGVILLGCVAGFDDFFFIDDAQNECLPFFREMGRLWLSGDLPLLTTHTWLGGNMFLDMVLSPFSPQTIVASLLAATSEGRTLPVLAFAGTNFVLVVFSGWWLGRIYGLGRRWSLLLGFLLATQPMFLYVFAASWWNSASAYAWFLFAFAALLHLRRSLAPGAFALAAAGGCALFASAMTQLHLAYALLCVIVAVADFRAHRSLRRIALLALAPASAFLVAAVPLMAEYVMSSGWVMRSSGWHNNGGEQVSHWGLLLNTFNPFYGSYTTWFGHQQHLPSLGYSTALLFFALAFFRWKPPATPEQKVLLAFGFAAFLLCFLPSQTGPMRYPIRFLPALAVPLSVYALQRVAHGTARIDQRTIKRAAAFIATVTLLTYFSAESGLFYFDALMRLAMVPVLFGGGALVLVHLLRQPTPRDPRVSWAMLISAFAWVVGLALTPSLGGSKWPYAILPDTDAIRPTGRPGYVLGLCDRGSAWGRPEQLGELISGRYLLYGQPAINGYSPVGHKGFAHHFPYGGDAHGLFQPRATLVDMARPAPGLPGIHVHQLFEISDIFACDRDLDAPLVQQMAAAGLQPAEAGLRDGRVRIRAVNQLASIGSLLRLPDADGVVAAAAAAARREAFEVPGRAEARHLHFSRLYWPGYSATLAGQPLPVRPYLGAVVEVEVPPGGSGRLDLHYEPVSWRWTRWSLLVGLLVIGGTMAGLAVGRRRRA
ncbi:MAG: hypothetical protein JWP60_1587 [Ramlibacter sp.]|nr:hypothetical protein [Ramlibacter sp.]